MIKPGYTRITDIIADREALSKIPKENLENARLRGTRVDELAKAYTLGLPAIAEREDDAGFFESFKLFAENKLDSLVGGVRQYDDVLLLTGEPDFIYQENGLNVLLDIKCTAKESVTWKLQAAGYDYLLEQNGILIDRIEFARLKKDGTKPVVYTYDKSHRPMFMNFYHRYIFLGKHKEEYEDYLRYI